jgi:ligand-binding sensor domain-containing protein
MQEGLPGNHIFMLHITTQGRLWIGTNNGMVSWNQGQFSKPLTTEQGLYANGVFSMATDEIGQLWLGSYGGLARIQVLKPF